MYRFVKNVCRSLSEPKQHLMKKVFELKGKSFILSLVEEVEEVEQSGGQVVADGSRRRTKGGVFFNLLKGKVSKEQWDKVFEDEKEAQKRRKATKRRFRYMSPESGNEPKALSYKDCLNKHPT